MKPVWHLSPGDSFACSQCARPVKVYVRKLRAPPFEIEAVCDYCGASRVFTVPPEWAKRPTCDRIQFVNLPSREE